MLNVRLARESELPGLVASEDPQILADTTAYLTKLLDIGCTRPSWCFVAESNGATCGSIVLWAPPGAAKPSDFVLWNAPWDQPEVATALLNHARQTARRLGAAEQGHVLDTPAQDPQWQISPKEREQILEREGFTVARDGRRYNWTSSTGVPDQDQRLNWRNLPDLGPAPFVDLLEDLLSDTADSLLRTDIARLGLRGAAEDLFAETRELDHRPEWFEIGYDADGRAAAISMPGRNPNYAVIGFVGVAPHHRGNGYSTSVVARGTRILAEAGETEIRGDCDFANIAMSKGFERAGYRNFADRKEFRRPL